jgi:mono/diheme cytochrome c family protein
MPVNRFVLGFVTAIAVLWLGTWSYLTLGLAGVPADENAPRWEAQLMASAVRASVRRSAVKMQNPMPPTIENLVAGGKLYVNGCAGCHGALGKPPEPPETLYTPIPKLPWVGTQYSDAEVFWIVKHGIRRTGMSAYGPFYTEQEMWNIAAFIENIRNLPPGVLKGIQSKKQ